MKPVVVVCPLQPSLPVNSGWPGPGSSILVSSQWACHISLQVKDHWGELRNRTGEVHPMIPQSGHLEETLCFSRFLLEFRSLQCPERSCDRVVLCRLCKRVSSSLMDGGRMLSTLLSFMFLIAVLTNEV